MDVELDADECLGRSVIPDYFEASSSVRDRRPVEKYSIYQTRPNYSWRTHGSIWLKQRFPNTSSILKMFHLPRINLGSREDEKVILTKAELESLCLEINNAEEREAQLKARLEHVDEILKSAHLAGYLHVRTRWTALPWEPPVDDADIDDWLERFIVLHGEGIFFFAHSTDLSPQDAILLSEIAEYGPLPEFMQGDEQRCSFYMLTKQGLRFECSSASKIVIGAWLSTIRLECGLEQQEAVED